MSEIEETNNDIVEAVAPTYVTYDDFAKLEIKLGTITAVEAIPEADRLLKLTVEVGEPVPRQIVSGIREYFEDIDFLVGKQCPFVVNLEPRVIRGYESQGMIMAAEHDGVFSLLIPYNELPAGTDVN